METQRRNEIAFLVVECMIKRSRGIEGLAVIGTITDAGILSGVPIEEVAEFVQNIIEEKNTEGCIKIKLPSVANFEPQL